MMVMFPNLTFRGIQLRITYVCCVTHYYENMNQLYTQYKYVGNNQTQDQLVLLKKHQFLCITTFLYLIENFKAEQNY